MVKRYVVYLAPLWVSGECVCVLLCFPSCPDASPPLPTDKGQEACTAPSHAPVQSRSACRGMPSTQTRRGRVAQYRQAAEDGSMNRRTVE